MTLVKIAARLLAVVLLGMLSLVACSDDQQACAATVTEPMAPTSQQTYKPPSTTRRNNQPGSTRTTSKVQDKPRTGTNSGSTGKRTTTIKPNWKSTAKPTTWGGYKQDRNWSKPYHSGYPVPQQPIIINQYGHDYRTYPGYIGYYPVGVWPMGYGTRYGCVAETEATPAASPTPAPTVTVTATPDPTVTVTATPTSTPSETPR